VSSEAFCREAGAPAGSDTHYALLFHRRADHRALCALLALRREILDIAEGSADPGVRGMRRSWWQEEILRAAGGTARHPVGIELQPLALQGVVDPAALIEFSERAAPPGLWLEGDADAWLAEIEAIHAPVWRAVAAVCTQEGAAAADIVRAGTLVEAVYRLRAAGEALRTGSGPLPRTLTSGAAAIDAASLARLAERLAAELHGQEAVLASKEPVPVFVAVMAQLATALSREIAADPDSVLRGRIALTPLRKLWIAWRTHRRLGRG
jgi:phytoene synthase